MAGQPRTGDGLTGRGGPLGHDFEPIDPFDAVNTLPTGRHETSRRPVLRRERGPMPCADQDCPAMKHFLQWSPHGKVPGIHLQEARHWIHTGAPQSGRHWNAFPVLLGYHPPLFTPAAPHLTHTVASCSPDAWLVETGCHAGTVDPPRLQLRLLAPTEQRGPAAPPTGVACPDGTTMYD
jgi:hypothetical protein